MQIMMPVKSSMIAEVGIGLSNTLSVILDSKSSNNMSVKNKKVKKIFIHIVLIEAPVKTGAVNPNYLP